MNAAANVTWVGVAQGVRILSQFGNMLVLARFLPPSEYGLMAMAAVVTNLALLFRDLGTAAAIIHREQLSEATKTSVFWLNLAMGCMIAAVVAGGSPFIAQAFQAPALAQVLCALALVFPLASSSAVHQALLERASAFRTVARIESVSAAAALGAAIVAAWLGAGVYSLVLQAVLIAALTTLQLWIASDWRPNGRPRLAELKDLFHFSGHMTAYQLISYLFRNADAMVVGRMLGASALGAYSMAYKLMLFPVQNITWAAARALYPVMSRQQSAIDEMGRLFLRSIGYVSFITAPLMVGMFVLRELFVELAFGAPWARVADILFWLAPVGYLQSIVGTTGPVFMAQGRTGLLMRLAIYGAALHVTAFVVGAHWGVNGVAACYLAASILNAAPTLHLALRATGQGGFSLLDAIWLPLAFALVMGTGMHFLAPHIVVPAPYLFLKLGALGFFGAAVYLGLCYLFLQEQTRAVIFFSRNA